MSPSCTLLSPAQPSEFLSHVLDYYAHPTTLIICSSRSEFLASLVEDVCGGHEPEPRSVVEGEHAGDGDADQAKQHQHQIQHRLLCSPMYQVAVSRHVRTVYIPTATHLRAYLSVFSAEDPASRVAAPPARFAASASAAASASKRRPHLLLYGFLDLHRDTSEWSAQGLGSSASALVDLGRRLSWDVAVVEPRRAAGSGGDLQEGTRLEDVLRETVPILSGGGRRLGLESEDGGWSGRRVEVGRVLMRWFRFQRGRWEEENAEGGGREDTAMTDRLL